MTRETQKETERRILDSLLSAIEIKPDRVDEGERPDFVLIVSGRVIGIELTMYQSEATVDAGCSQRAAESEWEALQKSLRDFLKCQLNIEETNIGLIFTGKPPARREHQNFMLEIASFIRIHAGDMREHNTMKYQEFSLPLMRKYLREIHLRKGISFECYSNVTVGWIAPTNYKIADIVSKKSCKAKNYKKTDELWLLIQCSYRISETFMPINGVLGFDDVPCLLEILQQSLFSKVYVFAIGDVFQWERRSGWTNIAPAGKPR